LFYFSWWVFSGREWLADLRLGPSGEAQEQGAGGTQAAGPSKVLILVYYIGESDAATARALAAVIGCLSSHSEVGW
jgi:hypothetical protein